MKKLILSVAIASAVFSQGAFAEDASIADSWKMPSAIAYPGYAWGNIQYPNSIIKDTADYQNMVYQGKVEQGAVWFNFGDTKQFRLNTFVDLNYTVDTRGLVYNNKVLPGIGVKIQQQWAEKVVSEYGVKLVYEDQWKQGGGTGWGAQAFVNYWGGWDLKGN